MTSLLCMHVTEAQSATRDRATQTPIQTPDRRQIQAQAREVADRLIGIVDTTAQAKLHRDMPSVRMTTCVVRVHVVNSTSAPSSTPPVIWLYQEQALTKNLSKPYRQRFLRIAPTADGTRIESAGFKPPQPQQWAGLCDRPETKRVILPADLGQSECSVFLHRDGENYVGETQAGGCPSNYRGAVKITNRIVLHTNGMDTHDRGFDAKGKLVWGAQDKPYEFRRILPKAHR